LTCWVKLSPTKAAHLIPKLGDYSLHGLGDRALKLNILPFKAMICDILMVFYVTLKFLLVSFIRLMTLEVLLSRLEIH